MSTYTRILFFLFHFMLQVGCNRMGWAKFSQLPRVVLFIFEMFTQQNRAKELHTFAWLAERSADNVCACIHSNSRERTVAGSHVTYVQ